MDTTTTVGLLWAAFIATHLGLASTRVEPVLRKRMGDQPFLGLYSLVALALFVPLVWIYLDNRHADGWIWAVPVGPVPRAVLYVLMTVALALLVAGGAQASPAAVAPGSPKIAGAYRITRHPVVLGTGLLMALHLIPNGSAADIAFFGGFTLFTVLGAWHQDVRKLAVGKPEFVAFHEQTRFLSLSPAAWARGLIELPLWVWAASGVATLGIRWLHPTGIWPH